MAYDFYNLLSVMRNIGLSVIYHLGNFGYNFFFRSINSWLFNDSPINLFGEMTAFEFFITTGLIVWFVGKLVKWIIF